jgi:hypothetical protein
MCKLQPTLHRPWECTQNCTGEPSTSINDDRTKEYDIREKGK